MNTINNSFFSKIFRKPAFLPPENVQKTFKELFPDVINIEWTLVNSNYEVIFYKDQVECIAIFNNEAFLLIHKMFLSEDYLPQTIKNRIITKGEIMNVVMINQGNLITYEIIYRDLDLNRFMIKFDILGNIIDEQSL